MIKKVITKKCNYCEKGKIIYDYVLLGDRKIHRKITKCRFCNGSGKLKILIEDYTKSNKKNE